MTTFRPNYNLSEDQKTLVEGVRGQAESLLSYFDEAKDSREISIAKTKLEEAVMWAIKGITAK